MSLWAIIPVKPLRRGKSRLAGVLSEDERSLLNSTMLGNVLLTLSSVPEVDEVLVVSRDTAALAMAREYGVRTLQEDGKPGLNLALERATIVVQKYAVQEILILPADLPLITVRDVQEVIRMAGPAPSIVIAPDRRNNGTNALYISPPGLLQYAYGPGSFQRHVEQAEQRGARVEVCKLTSLALDLDLPEDLELLRQIQAVQIDP
ncbi:MAG: 2-phospho-L-lactate guanylyltransferase [Anaerolinea sp.]|nr:2-phospho-L-lactate guanylyltransferase [Anaerolinea sp.]